jgi:hypothetical protein
MSTGPEQRVRLRARVAAACYAHPALALLAVALVVAAGAATGYLVRARTSHRAPETAVGAVVTKPGSADSIAKARDTVVWREETGAIYRAKVVDGRFDQFLRQRNEALEALRTDSRNQAASEILAALKPVFAGMKARVPGYADWYFGYTTRYQLMAHALLPALVHLSRKLDFFSEQNPRQQRSLVQSIGAHMVAYLEEQYADRVVRPAEAEIRLQATFDKSYDTLHAHWASIVAEQSGAMRVFIAQQSGSAERLSADQTTGLRLDWDGSRDDGTAMHQDRVIDQSFRGGLLSVRLKVPKPDKAPVKPDLSETTSAEADQITQVIMNLFDKVVGPVVSQMGDLAIGVFAGSAASGTTVGFGMAGAPIFVTAGVGTAVPLGAAIGLAATIAAEMLSNRMEEALDRPKFEESVGQTVDAMENSIETKMISVLDEHVDASYSDIVNPVPIK